MNYLVLIKIVTVYFLIFFVLKFMGKREIGQLSLVDFVVILIIADIAAIGIDTSDHPFYIYIIGIAILAIIQKLLSKILLRVPKLRTFFDGTVSYIIIEGKINLKEMRKQSYNIDDLISQLRLKNVRSLSEVRYGLLEANGELAVFKFDDFTEGSKPSVNTSFKPINVVGINKSSEAIEQDEGKKNCSFQKRKYFSFSINHFGKCSKTKLSIT